MISLILSIAVAIVAVVVLVFLIIIFWAKISLKLIIVTVVVILIATLIYIFGLPSFSCSTEKEEVVQEQQIVEALVLVQEYYLTPGSEWITPKIDYKFKFRSEGHAFNVQFSTENNGWTEKVPIPKEGDVIITIPSNGIQGSAKVTAGANETNGFRVQLYKKINLLQ